MRGIAKRTLREFWERGYDDTERALTEWYRMMEKANWATPQALKAEIRTASILKGAERCLTSRAISTGSSLRSEMPSRSLGYALSALTPSTINSTRRLCE